MKKLLALSLSRRRRGANFLKGPQAFLFKPQRAGRELVKLECI